MQTLPLVKQRYQAALDRLVARLEEDYYVLAVVLYGSLARGEAWERSDIDMVIVLRDGQEREARELWVVEDDINVFAWVTTRNEFKRALEGALQGSITHSVRSQHKLLFSRDESITQWVQEPPQVGAHDQELQLLRVSASVMYPLEKATKWLVAKHDLYYCYLWTLYAVNNLASVEVVLNGMAPGREALDQALSYNPQFFGAAYLDFIDSPKSEASLQAALACIENYLEERSARLFKSVLSFLAQAQAPVPASELQAHFKKKLHNDDLLALSMVYEWLARKGIIHKLSTPLRLTRKSQAVLEEPSYYYDTDDLSEWE